MYMPFNKNILKVQIWQGRAFQLMLQMHEDMERKRPRAAWHSTYSQAQGRQDVYKWDITVWADRQLFL